MGFRLDLRYDYFNQDQLRTGTGRVDLGSARLPSEREIQQQTINRNMTLGLDYSPTANWGINVLIPVYDRTHETAIPGDTETSSSQAAGLGDVRVIGRFQGLAKDHSVGIQLGLKFPTGRFDGNFAGGPQAGTPLDRGLQLGSGTTDLLVGIFKFGSLSPQWGYFVQASYQIALGGNDGYRPGNGLNLNAGVRDTRNPAFTPQIQVNMRSEKPESGVNADTSNSGSTSVYVSPGATFRLAEKIHISTFAQIPIYQRVSGYQIRPRFLASVGVHYSY